VHSRTVAAPRHICASRGRVGRRYKLRANDDGGASRVIQDWVLEMWGCATIAARLIPMGVCVLLGTFPT
jgi:hypothetical protein